MLIYIDSENKCHAENGEGRREFEVPFFDGKCKTFIEGYRFTPPGETCADSHGVEFSGTSPWKDYDQLAAAQAQYESMRTEIADMQVALAKMGVAANG